MTLWLSVGVHVQHPSLGLQRPTTTRPPTATYRLMEQTLRDSVDRTRVVMEQPLALKPLSLSLVSK